jgi:hypothetical protein
MEVSGHHAPGPFTIGKEHQYILNMKLDWLHNLFGRKYLRPTGIRTPDRRLVSTPS